MLVTSVVVVLSLSFSIVYSQSNLEISTKLPINESLPVVLWHGMGDSCCNPMSMGYIQGVIEENVPGVYVHSLMIGSNVVEDTSNGFFMNINTQIEQACKTISEDPKLSNGFNAVGFSQGALFLRGLVQRCPNARMRNLISIGGPHQGVYGLPHCPGTSVTVCDYIRKMLNHFAYYSFVQNHLVQAEYWHNPMYEDDYREYSAYLSDINQERNVNETYRRNLMSLSNFVMVMFERDSMVQPKISQWFGFYKPGQATVTYSLNETSLYTEDRLGLKQMDVQGKLHFLSVDGDHLRFKEQWFIDNIINKYLI